jgi:hypothetical protein
MLSLHTRLSNDIALTAVACVWLFSVSPVVASGKEWHGITPAKSTRDDVVRLFGQCSDPKARCEFSSEEGEILIVFSGAFGDYFKCAAQLPAGTVLLIEVSPKAKLRLSDLRGDRTDYKELAPPNADSFDYRVYLDEEAGLLIRTSQGLVKLVSYLAAANDRQACADYYGRVESASEQFPLCRLPMPEPSKFSQFGSVTTGDERAALDAFATELQDKPGAQAYVIAYAGRKSRGGEARARAERAKAYLMSKHGMEDGRIVIVDGGHREGAAVELFTVPAGAVPPTPTPTLDPKGAPIVPDKKVKKPSNR